MKEHIKILKETEKKYRTVFGDDSLNRVILCEPFPSEEESYKVVNILKKAIKSNEPLKQIDEETWSKLVF